MCNCLDNVVFEGTFPPFVFCPYCGKKLADDVTKDEVLFQEDEAAFERLNDLEEIIEDKFDDIMVESADILAAHLTQTMNDSGLVFPMTVHEEKIEIRYEGHYEVHTIELFLEQEDEESPLYTVSVF